MCSPKQGGAWPIESCPCIGNPGLDRSAVTAVLAEHCSEALKRFAGIAGEAYGFVVAADLFGICIDVEYPRAIENERPDIGAR
ncbi:hypothetical protein [Paraburkholderia sp. BL10I2N1]|uniref:hypothetical protein n=1 Tax=Paraburkholderia sp. BL10I2N1 TaxID=1938796 RepID=UPI00105D507F|nr:hypothetical protein [Paraburkholderia sp. BL10I2N1]TDN59146.1 hypothetical protein B0G77_8338 [Paraburkholderia sp. BL10I2N1]